MPGNDFPEMVGEAPVMVGGLQGDIFLLSCPRFAEGFFGAFLQPDDALFMFMYCQAQPIDKFTVDFSHFLYALRRIFPLRQLSILPAKGGRPAAST